MFRLILRKNRLNGLNYEVTGAKLLTQEFIKNRAKTLVGY